MDGAALSWQAILFYVCVGLAYIVVGILLTKFVKIAWLGSAVMILFGASVCGTYFYLLNTSGP